MRDKVGCKNEFDHNLQNLSESFGKLNICSRLMYIIKKAEGVRIVLCVLCSEVR